MKFDMKTVLILAAALIVLLIILIINDIIKRAKERKAKRRREEQARAKAFNRADHFSIAKREAPTLERNDDDAFIMEELSFSEVDIERSIANGGEAPITKQEPVVEQPKKVEDVFKKAEKALDGNDAECLIPTVDASVLGKEYKKIREQTDFLQYNEELLANLLYQSKMAAASREQRSGATAANTMMVSDSDDILTNQPKEQTILSADDFEAKDLSAYDTTGEEDLATQQDIQDEIDRYLADMERHLKGIQKANKYKEPRKKEGKIFGLFGDSSKHETHTAENKQPLTSTILSQEENDSPIFVDRSKTERPVETYSSRAEAKRAAKEAAKQQEVDVHNAVAKMSETFKLILAKNSELSKARFDDLIPQATIDALEDELLRLNLEYKHLSETYNRLKEE